MSYIPPEDARYVLADFVVYVRDLLKTLVYGNRDPQKREIFDEEFRPDLELAFEELEPQFEVAIVSIQSVGDDVLRAHGLWGAQLRLKRKIVRYFRDQFERHGKGALRDLLEVIDDLLDSIDVPGVKAISEFKKAAKNCIR